AITLLVDLLEKSMRLMHPFLSFITEEIYQKLPNHKGYCITAEYPTFDEKLVDKEAFDYMSALQETIKTVRAMRATLSVPPEKKLRVVLKTNKDYAAFDYLNEEKALLESFMGASSVTLDKEDSADVEGAFPTAGIGYSAYLFIKDAFDIETEIKKLTNELEKVNASLEQSKKKLSNENFISHAKSEAIAKENAKKAEFMDKIEKINEHLAIFKSL
ncbi:MAG: class I tRNA ligase family protein, partial [Spirochaetales bacterium]|nr:class I tRNA ligase family protein [Spirochaetales bacterium]